MVYSDPFQDYGQSMVPMYHLWLILRLRNATIRAVQFHGNIVIPRYWNEAISVSSRFLCNDYNYHDIEIIAIIFNVNDHDSIYWPLW